MCIKSIDKRKISNILVIITLTMCFFTIFTPPNVHAAWFTGTDDGDDWGPIDMCVEILQGPFDPIIQIMSGDDSKPFYAMYKTATGEDALPRINDFYNALKGIGALWVLAIAMGRVFTNIQNGRDPVEAVFKIFVEICIAGLFIMNLDEIIAAILGLGRALLGNFIEGAPIAPSVTDVSEDSEEFREIAKQMMIALTGTESPGSWERAKAIAILIVPWLFSYLAKIAAQLAVLQILAEIGIRRAFAPLAIGDVYAEGLRSPGVRYLKKIFASVLKLSVCAAACIFTAAFMANIAGSVINDIKGTQSTMGGLALMLAVDFMGISLMFKAGEFTNDIMGV